MKIAILAALLAPSLFAAEPVATRVLPQFPHVTEWPLVREWRHRLVQSGNPLPPAEAPNGSFPRAGGRVRSGDDATVAEVPLEFSGRSHDAHSESASSDWHAIMRKLNDTRMARVEFRDVPVRDALNSLALNARELDPAGVGVKFVLLLDEPPGASAGDPAAVKPGDVRITLSLYNVPLLEVLKYVTNLASLKYRIRGQAVYITPLGHSSSPLYVKEWKLPADALREAVQADGTIHARNFLTSRGVEFQEGSLAMYNPVSSTLVVKNNEVELDLVERLVELQIASHLAKSAPRDPSSAVKPGVRTDESRSGGVSQRMREIEVSVLLRDYEQSMSELAGKNRQRALLNPAPGDEAGARKKNELDREVEALTQWVNGLKTQLVHHSREEEATPPTSNRPAGFAPMVPEPGPEPLMVAPPTRAGSSFDVLTPGGNRAPIGTPSPAATPAPAASDPSHGHEHGAPGLPPPVLPIPGAPSPVLPPRAPAIATPPAGPAPSPVPPPPALTPLEPRRLTPPPPMAPARPSTPPPAGEPLLRQ